MTDKGIDKISSWYVDQLAHATMRIAQLEKQRRWLAWALVYALVALVAALWQGVRNG